MFNGQQWTAHGLHSHLGQVDIEVTSEEATKAYVDLAEKLKKLIPFGYSAAVYTQTTDVESEINGIMTYDRKVVKLNEEQIRKANLEVIATLKK